MGDVIDFKSALRRMEGKRENRKPAADGAELTYDPKPGSVGVTVSGDAPDSAHFKVVAPADEVDVAMRQAREALVRNFGVDPRDGEQVRLVREQMGAGQFDAFVTTFVQQHFFAQALLRTGLLPFLSPDLLTSEPPVEGRDYVFEVETLLRPTFELTSYDPVAVELPAKREVASKDVTAYLDAMADELGTWENDPARDAVADGDRVSLNLEATTPDGREVKALTGRHVPYQVGSGVLGEEFDRTVASMKPRERREVSLSLPAVDGDPQSFQMVKIKMQLDEIQRKVPARIDDAWVAANMPEAQTLLGLRAKVRTLLERESQAAYRSELMMLTADELAKRLKGEIGDRYLEKMTDELFYQFCEDLQAQGVDYLQYMAQPDFDQDAWRSRMADDARRTLARGFALDALADHLDIDLEEADIAKVVAQMAPGRAEEALQGLIESGQMPKLCEVALRTRANEWLVDNVKDAGRPKLHLV